MVYITVHIVFKETKNNSILEYWTMVSNFVMTPLVEVFYFVNTLPQKVAKSFQTFMSCFYPRVMCRCQIAVFSHHVYILLFFLETHVVIRLIGIKL